MSDPGFPFGMDPDALRDAPLFQELQRVMASSSGPVNWELARQVAVATAVEAGADPDPTDEDRETLAQAVRVAELQVAGFTGLAAPTDVVEVRPVRRAGWVLANVDGLRGLLEPAAARMGEALGRAMAEGMPGGDGTDGRSGDAARSPAPGHAGRAGPRVPRPTGARAVRRRGAARRGPGRVAVRRAEPRRVRARLGARSDRVPDVRRAARGDPPLRVRPGVGAPRGSPGSSTTSSRR